MPSSIRHLIRRVGRCLLVAVCSLAYLIAAIGFPVVIRPLKASDDSEPFACQGRACGCATAEQCRKSCCCSRNAAPVAEEEPPACEHEGGCCSETTSPPKPHSTPRIKWVIGAHAQQCQGLTLTWIASGVTLPPPPIVVLRPDETVHDRPLAFSSAPEQQPLDPPSPPPRLG
jgi:hypothetical protein